MESAHRRRPAAIWCALFTLAGIVISLAAANEVRVGSTTFLIPTPEGFAPVTREMPKLSAALDLSNGGVGKRLISFIPEASVPLAKERVPELNKSFHVQIAKDMVDATVAPDWFLQYKVKTRALLAELAKSDERSLPSELAVIEKQLEELDARDNDLAIDSVTFPPHQESDRVLAYSGLTRSNDAGPGSKSRTTVNTVAALFVKDKVVMVLVAGGKYDLAWTRTACSNWTAAILSANGAPGRLTPALGNGPAQSIQHPPVPRGELRITPR